MTTTTMAPTDVRRGSSISGTLLREWGACTEAADQVDDLWPDGCEVTLDNLRRAADEGLDVSWFAYAILPPPAWAEYERVTADAWAEYERVRAPALWDLTPEPEVDR